MAMTDNARFLISHLRNSFITSDDTGMCELIIESEDYDEYDSKSRLDSSSISDSGMDSDTNLSSSYDILPDMGYGHRRRSNTAQKLERMKKERRSQRKIKNVPWRDSSSEYNVEEKGHLFDKKQLPSENEEKKKPKMSSLSWLLENAAIQGSNPFLEYAKFDGKASVGATKKMDIFLTMALPADRSYPISVVVIATAKIQELIGLVCWQYTNEGREPMLHDNIERYCLHIAEDDGEVDMDFPSLDPKEPVSKFGFSKLALVEKDLPTAKSPKSSFVVTIFVPNRGFNKFQMENMNIPMRDILQRILKRRKIRPRPGLNYNLEKQEEPGVSIDLDATLASMDTMEFSLVRENSTRRHHNEGSEDEVSTMADSLTSHQYKSYIVSMVHRLRANTDVQLGVSGEKVEVDPVGSKGTKFFKQRAMTYDADNIASCEVLEEKSTGKSVFRITYLISHDYKHSDFEADSEVCNEIVSKINNILELRLSPARKDYVATRAAKHLRKRDSLRDSFRLSKYTDN